MLSKKFNFTKASLSSIPFPSKGKRAYYYDTKVRGLGISLTDKGTITFIVYRKIEGKPERITLGRFPDLVCRKCKRFSIECKFSDSTRQKPQQRQI